MGGIDQMTSTQDRQFSTSNTHFLSSKHTREIGHSLKCFFEIDAVQSIHIPMLKEIYYSIYVFLDHNSPDIMDELLDYEFHISKLYPKGSFIYSYLEDDPEKVFATSKIPIMSFNRENDNE